MIAGRIFISFAGAKPGPDPDPDRRWDNPATLEERRDSRSMTRKKSKVSTDGNPFTEKGWEREREGGRKWVFEKTVGRTNRTKLVVVAFIGVRSSAPRAASHKDQFILIKNRRDPPIINWNRKTLVKKTSVLEPRPRHACDVAVAVAAKVNSIRVFNSKPCG